MTSHSIPKRQRTVQTDWAADGQTCGMGRREETLLLRNIPASLPAAVSVVCYRVSDFVGGHLTGIMIADLPLEVVQFFCTLFCLCPFVILAYLYIQRAVLREFLCESADTNLKSCIFLRKSSKTALFCAKILHSLRKFSFGWSFAVQPDEKEPHTPKEKGALRCAAHRTEAQYAFSFAVTNFIQFLPSWRGSRRPAYGD